MFDAYAKDLKKYQADVPKVFKKVAKKTADKAENIAKDFTDKEGLVDTGAYKGAWEAESKELDKDTYAVYLNNSMDYASHLEWGHKVRSRTKLKTKLKKIKQLFRKKEVKTSKKNTGKNKKVRRDLKGYSDGKRVKGFFVGRNSLDEARYYAIVQLDKALEKARIAFNNSFVKKEE